MEQLHRDPFPVIPHSEAVAVVLLLVDLLAGIENVRLHPGHPFIKIQIIPEQPPVQGKPKRGNPPHRILQRPLEDIGIDRLVQGDAHPDIAAQFRRITAG